MSTVIGVSGRMNSGKTTLTNELAKKLDCKVVSFGDYVRKLAAERGLPLERIQLQKLGQDLVDNNLHSFCLEVISQGNEKPYNTLIIDGIRHKVVLQKIKELIPSQNFFFVFIKTTEEVLIERDETRPLSTPRELLEKDPTEIEVVNSLESFADIVIDNSSDIRISCDLIITRLCLNKEMN